MTPPDSTDPTGPTGPINGAGPSPTWYDVLGVAPDADEATIKAAWRAAIDPVDPGTPRFRALNQAADALLDPERRAAYDAALAAAEPTADRDGDAAASPPARTAPAAASGRAPRRHRPWLVSGLLVAALLLAVLIVVQVRAVHQQGAVDRAGTEARTAAEKALSAVLAYDHQHLYEDRARAGRHLTPTYRAEYEKNFDRLITAGPDGEAGPAVKTKAVVTAEVLHSAVVHADPGRVSVLVFVDQTATKEGQDAAIFQNRVVATMVRRDGVWLVDDLDSY